MSSCSRLPCPGASVDTHQCVVELESTDVVGGDVRSSQGLGDLGHNATLIWGRRGGRAQPLRADTITRGAGRCSLCPPPPSASSACPTPTTIPGNPRPHRLKA